MENGLWENIMVCISSPPTPQRRQKIRITADDKPHLVFSGLLMAGRYVEECMPLGMRRLGFGFWLCYQLAIRS